MKTLIIFLITLTAYSQPYVSLSVDVNNFLEIKDNPRMEKQINGLDFDVELGYIGGEEDGNIGVYVFYGAFPNAFYHNYGLGVDWYYNLLERLNLSLGNSYHVVIRDKKYKHLGATSSYFNPRSKISYDLSFLTIDLIAQLTKRNDIDKRIFEGKIGITKKL